MPETCNTNGENNNNSYKRLDFGVPLWRNPIKHFDDLVSLVMGLMGMSRRTDKPSVACLRIFTIFAPPPVHEMPGHSNRGLTLPLYSFEKKYQVSKGIYLISLCYSCYSHPLIFRSQPSSSFTSPSGFMVVNNPKNDKAVNNPNKPAGTTSNMNPSIQVLCSWLHFSALGSPHWHLLSPRCSRCGPSSF